MRHEDAELVWQGRLHLGDGPGVYGDAPYVGLALELPLMLQRFPDAEGPPDVHLLVETEGLQRQGGLAAPAISVVRYGAGGEPLVLGEGRLDEPVTSIAIEVGPEGPADAPLPLAVRLRVNTDAPPGLYADFVLTALRIDSATHYATLGFRAQA